MKKGGVGGSKTSKVGAEFEDSTYEILLNDFKDIGYSIKSIRKGNSTPRQISLINSKSNLIEIYFKAAIHKDFFEPRGVKSANYFSARLEPDTAIFSESTRTLTIIEKKQQTGSGSVAEKLQTCDFKMFYYTTLCKPLGFHVDLIWQLGSYFKEQETRLRSVFDYMKSKGSSYYFHKIPINVIKL